MTLALSSSLVSALFGTSDSGSTTYDPGLAVVTLRNASKAGAEEKGMAQQEKDPTTARALSQFNAAVSSAKDLNAALKDPRVLSVLLPALGLADQVQYPALAQKVLTSDPSESDSLVTRLASTTWTAATKTLDLANKGLAGLQDPGVLQTIQTNYVRYEYRQGLDKQSPGISDALYFEDNAASNTNVYNVLGDAVLRRVVTGALGLPQQIAIQPVETQARAVTSRVDTGTFTDAAAVQKLAERYVMYAAQNTTKSDGSTNLLAQYGWSA